MSDYYDGKWAFFPNHLTDQSEMYLYFYLLSETPEQVRSHNQIVGNPDSLPKTAYSLGAKDNGPMMVTRTEDPEIKVKGSVYQLKQN